jgi:hypothetical protein
MGSYWDAMTTSFVGGKGICEKPPDFGYMAWDRLDKIRMGTLFDVDGKVINRCRLAIVLELGLFSRTLLENVSLKTNIIRPSICEWFLWADSACKRDCVWLAR